MWHNSILVKRYPHHQSSESLLARFHLHNTILKGWVVPGPRSLDWEGRGLWGIKSGGKLGKWIASAKGWKMISNILRPPLIFVYFFQQRFPSLSKRHFLAKNVSCSKEVYPYFIWIILTGFNSQTPLRSWFFPLLCDIKSIQTSEKGPNRLIIVFHPLLVEDSFYWGARWKVEKFRLCGKYIFLGNQRARRTQCQVSSTYSWAYLSFRSFSLKCFILFTVWTMNDILWTVQSILQTHLCSESAARVSYKRK